MKAINGTLDLGNGLTVVSLEAEVAAAGVITLAFHDKTVWRRLAQVVRDTGRSIYQVKFGMLEEYMRQELRSPSVTMSFV